MKTKIATLVLCLSIAGLFSFTPQPVEIVNPDKSHLAFVVEASRFIQFFESDKNEFTGIFIKVKDDRLFFSKVLLKNNSFVEHVLNKQIELTPILIHDSGAVQQIEVADITEDFLTPYQVKMDLSYFPWEDLKMIAVNSEKLYFSMAALDYGASIHATQDKAEQQGYSTIKVEGDFKNADTRNNAEKKSVTPMYIAGAPCPPVWRMNR